MRVSRLTDVPRSLPRHRLTHLALAAVIAVAATACTGARPQLATKVESTTTAFDGGGEDADVSEVAEATTNPIAVYPNATDDTPTRQIAADDATSAPDVPVVFLVKRHRGERLEVYLPTAPAGSTGWVSAEDVALSRVAYRIEISLSSHRLRVLDEGRPVLDERISVGVADRPTAGTKYYVKELLQPPDQGGPYGRFTYVLSGASTSLDSFTSGEGIIGIHGTSARGSIGEDTPAGSIGVEPDVLDRLIRDIGLPLGTPVTVLP